MAEATVISNGTVWVSWVDSATSGTTTSSAGDYVWATWATASTSSATSGNDWGLSPTPSRPAETEEQRQAKEEREQQQRLARLEKREADGRAREAARQKAEELLRSSLDEQQLEQFNETKWFVVISQSGKRYRIRRDWIGNVDELNQDDRVIAKYCIHPRATIPVADSMLTQKLMLEADEARFTEIANRMAV